MKNKIPTGISAYRDPKTGQLMNSYKRNSDMDERDAKHQGLEIHRREMAFVRGFVTCTNCGACYDQNNEPTFCQMYSRPVDPGATEQNIFMAEACDQWVPNGLDRNKVVHPAHRYSYDD